MRAITLSMTLAALAAAAPAQSELAAEFGLDETGVYAVFQTSMGQFIAVLHEDRAPITVENFIGLATGEKSSRPVDRRSPELQRLAQEIIASGEVRSRAELDARLEERLGEVFEEVTDTPFYDGTVFHRIIDGFMVQGGAPASVRHGSSGPGFTIPDEFHPELRHDRVGTLSMANTGQPNTGGSQFFVCVDDSRSYLDDAYSLFGQVIEGYEIVEAISRVPVGPDGQSPLEEVVLEHVIIVRVGEDEAADEEQPATAPSED